MALGGRLLQPFERLDRVGFHAATLSIGEAELELRIQIALIGGFAKPFDGLSRIGGGALAIEA